MNYLEIIKSVLKSEADSLLEASEKVSEQQCTELNRIYSSLSANNGSLIFCGVGKSGVIAQKLSSTFSSLGLSSFFLHPIEALHGDLGNVKANDAICFISKSGTTEEIVKLMPFLPVADDMKLGLLGNANSTIASNCSLVFDCSVSSESCKNNLAPTNSSTLALAMGDAMAVVYEHFVDLSSEGFAKNHPGGLLGKSLSFKVKDLMIASTDLPVLSANSSLKEVILDMTQKPFGMAAIVSGEKLEGIIVEGDIRRAFAESDNAYDISASDIMTKNPITIESTDLVRNAVELMENREKPLSVLPVVDGEKFLGLIRVHELFKEGFSKKD